MVFTGQPLLTDTHRLAGDKLDNGSITRLNELRAVFKRFASSAINLLLKLSELARNVSSVAIEDGSVTSTDLTRVVEDDDLGIKGSSLLGGVVFGIRSDVATADILDGDVPSKSC
jgi:hypothetical protein